MTPLAIQQLFRQALQHHHSGRLPDAERLYRQILAAEPTHAASMLRLGMMAREVGRRDVALDLLRRAINLNPHSAEAYYYLGVALIDVGELNDAIAALGRSVALQPDSAAAQSNLGVALYETARFEQAIAAYRRSIQLGPDSASAHWNLAIALLILGRLPEGWDEFEWRLKFPELALSRDFPSPQWTGEELSNKTLLLYTEGGFGDAIQFVRYVPRLRGRAKTVILECQPTLAKLFSDLPGVDRVVQLGQSLPEFDYHIPLQSLPRLFKTDLTNIPSNVPYLNVAPDDRSRWSTRIPSDGRLKVGLVWAGSPRPKITDDIRTRGLDVFAPLGRVPNVHLFSLQKGPESTLARPPGLELTDFTAELNDFTDTAGLIANLDLVISVDTSVAHLAGALAKPVWVLIPFIPDFRWLIGRTDSPWYPTMRLFRQKRRDDWESVIADVTTALAEAARVGSMPVP